MNKVCRKKLPRLPNQYKFGSITVVFYYVSYNLNTLTHLHAITQLWFIYTGETKQAGPIPVSKLISDQGILKK